MTGLGSDLRSVRRRLGGSPAYAWGVVLAVALATAAAAVMYALVDAVLLKPLPFEDPERLVWIWATRTDRDRAFFSVDDFLDHRAASRTVPEVAAFAALGVHLGGSGPPERLLGARVSASAFRILGVRAARGRALEPADEDPEAEPVAVLAHGVWQRRFGGDPGAVGTVVRLNDEAHRVVGVLGPDFLFPGPPVDVVMPLAAERDPRRGDRGTNFLRVFGRLAGDATREQAREEWGRVSRDLRARFPVANAKKTEPRVLLLGEEMVGAYRRSLFALLGAVAAVLALACANVATLQLVRSSTREHELAVRRALGASPGDVLRLQALETGLLVVGGGLLGLGLAGAALDAVLALVPTALPRAGEARVDASVVAAALGCTALAAAISAVLPALADRGRGNPLGLLRADARAGGAPGRPRLRQGLAALEVAAAAGLLVTTALFLETYRRLEAEGPGVRVDGLVHVRLSLPPRVPRSQEAIEDFVARLREGVRAVPEVRAAGVGNALPLSGLNNRSDFVIVGRPPATASETPGGQLRWVSAGLAEALGLPLRRGRLFTEHDEQARAPVALVDETLARRFWEGRDPVGDAVRLEFGGPVGPEFRVVGVVGDVKHFDLADPPLGTLYLPVPGLQAPFRPFFAAGFSLAVAGAVEDAGSRRRIAAALARVDPDMAASALTSMGETLARAQASRGFTGAVLAVFAATALLLALSGLYAVVAAGVASRVRELGLRLALGATPARVLATLLGSAARPLVLGLAVGLLLAAAAVRALGPEIDPGPRLGELIWLATPLALGLAGLAAALAPARRALRLDVARILGGG